MAAPTIGRKSSGRGSRQGAYRPMSEINVTPFVDVMLVLLIIFMVTAPLLTVGVPVNLPRSKAQSLSDPIEPLVISLNHEGRLFVQETEIEYELLIPRLVAVTENNPETRIYLRGDQTLPYGRIMEVMGLVSSAGFKRVALITKLPGAEDDRP